VVDAASLVKTARERAHMSARELAAESGVSPSTVTRIERGELNPTLAMLERLLEASGNDLDVVVSPRRQRPTLARLRSHRRAITNAVRSFGGDNVRVFGSVARGESRIDSDVDLLIDVAPGTGLVTIERMTEAIEAVVPWHVDVLTSGAARGRMAHVVDEAVPL
jgi:predicted nucleotidyltransferase/DNA-binding XRE family transcriptional regulator